VCLVRLRRCAPWAILGTLVVAVAAAIWLASVLSGTPARPVVTAAPRPAASIPTPVPREGGASCSLPSGTPSITLSDTTPVPTITVPVGTSFTVVVPPGGEAATDVTFNSGEVLPVKVTDLAALNERCTASLTDTGRRTVLVAQSPGQVGLFATITPPTQAAMPAWNGEAIVTNGT
jgi:hypothetical protein